MIKPNLRISIFGKTQSGKSYFAKKLVANYENRIMYDLKREYSHLGVCVNSLHALDNAVRSGCTKIVYQPIDIEVDHFDMICNYIWRNLRNIVFLVDEVHKYCTKFKIPENFNTLVTVGQGDPYNIGIIAITQRPANVHNDVISQSSIIVAFRLNLFSEAETVSKNTGIPIDILQNLTYHHYMIYNDTDTTGNSIQKYDPI